MYLAAQHLRVPAQNHFIKLWSLVSKLLLSGDTNKVTGHFTPREFLR